MDNNSDAGLRSPYSIALAALAIVGWVMVAYFWSQVGDLREQMSGAVKSAEMARSGLAADLQNLQAANGALADVQKKADAAKAALADIEKSRAKAEGDAMALKGDAQTSADSLAKAKQALADAAKAAADATAAAAAKAQASAQELKAVEAKLAAQETKVQMFRERRGAETLQPFGHALFLHVSGKGDVGGHDGQHPLADQAAVKPAEVLFPLGH